MDKFKLYLMLWQHSADGLVRFRHKNLGNDKGEIMFWLTRLCCHKHDRKLSQRLIKKHLAVAASR